MGSSEAVTWMALCPPRMRDGYSMFVYTHRPPCVKHLAISSPDDMMPNPASPPIIAETRPMVLAIAAKASPMKRYGGAPEGGRPMWETLGNQESWKPRTRAQLENHPFIQVIPVSQAS